MNAATTLPRPAPPALHGFNPWPFAVIAAFILFIAGTVTLVVVACKDRTDLVAADYYEQEIRYQSRIDQLQRAAPFAREINASFDPRQGRITVSLPRPHLDAGLAGTVTLYRPNHAEADRSYPLSPDADGFQHLPAEGLAPGLWKAQFRWRSGTDEYFADRSVIIAATTSLK